MDLKYIKASKPPGATEMLINGDFTVTTGWDWGSTYSHVSGAMNFDDTGYGYLWQLDADMVSSIKASTDYVWEFTISNASTGAYLKAQSSDNIEYVAYSNYTNGTYKVEFTTPSSIGTKGLELKCSNNSGSSFTIDDISLKEN